MPATKLNKESAAVYLHPDSLTPWEQNPRNNDEAVSKVADSIQRFGFAAPIIARKSDGRVIAGHTRLKAANMLGLDVVPVRFMDLDDQAAAALALADNRIGEVATWNDDGLSAILEDLEANAVDLDGLGWSADELADLLTPTFDPDGTEDDIPAIGEVADSVVGEVYELGPHRLACGDCTDPAVWDSVISSDIAGAAIVDPPYGMDLDTEYSKIDSAKVAGRDYRSVIGDDQPFDAAPIMAVLGDVAEQFWFGADYYRKTIEDGGSWLVWDKRVPELDAAVGNAFELCWSRRKHKRHVLRYLWSGFTARERGEPRAHPTQKPIAMISDILNRWAPTGAFVVDPFAGSGTTLIACATTGRRARLIELDPRYCDVIRRRWTAWADKHGQDPGPGALSAVEE